MRNKNGWGIAIFLAFLIIFILGLLIAFYGIKQLGLIDENLLWHDSNEEVDTTDYSSLENKVTNATKEYISEHNENIKSEKYIKITELVKEKYIEEITDSSKNKCTGYVKITNKNDKLIYEPYIKCNKYTSNGYDERKDS